MKKIFLLLLCVVCIFSFCGCELSEITELIPGKTTQSNPEESSKANQKAILGTWLVESVEEYETENLLDITIILATNMMFVEGRTVKFLSNGSLTANTMNMDYELVDDQILCTYDGETIAYDYTLSGSTMTLTNPDVVSVTLTKQ